MLKRLQELKIHPKGSGLPEAGAQASALAGKTFVLTGIPSHAEAK